MWRRCLVAVLALAFAAGAQPPAAAKAGTSQEEKKDFLLFGTIFTHDGFSLPGAEIQVRRAGEKKTKWKARSDRRGEFVVHVPPGAEYEVTVQAKGFQRQEKKIDARTGDRDDMVFRLTPAQGGK